MQANLNKLKRQLNKKVFKSLSLLNVITIAVAFMFLVGDVSAIAWSHHNSHKITPVKAVARKNVQKAKPVVVTAPTTTTSPTTSTKPTPMSAPVSVPQTVSNNQHLALLCSQAQGSYDQLSVSALNQEESETSAANGDAAQINQINQTYNSEVAGEYAGYLEQVQAVPGCVADFSAPTPFPMLPTN